MKEKLQSFGLGVGFALALYLVVASVTYAFRHPEMTDTQRILHMKDVVMWR